MIIAAVELVAAWHDERHVHLVVALGNRRVGRRADARWTLFFNRPPDDFAESVMGLDAVDRVRLVDNRRNLRIDCRSRGDRLVVRDALAAEFGRGRVLEADVDPVTRYVADHQNVRITESLRTVYVDIEAQEPGKSIQDARDGKVRILAWTAVGCDGLRAGSVLGEDDDRAEILHLAKLVEFLRGYDVIIGWFLGGAREGRGFDADAIRNRHLVLGVEPVVPWLRWNWLDLLEVWKEFTQGDGDEKSSNKLADVAPRLLGEEHRKIDLDVTKIWKIWNSGPDGKATVLKYCFQDTDLLPLIAAKTGFVDLFLALCRICRIRPNTWSLQATAQGDGYLLGLGASMGWRWPSRWRGDEPTRKYAGAVVLEPRRTGVLEDVLVVDFSAMYMSIMDTLNMSPETLIDWKTTGISSCVVPGGRQVRFRTDRQGMVVMAIRDFRRQRAVYKAEAKTYDPGTPEYRRCMALSNGAKVAGNSMYGIMGSKWSRFYKPEVAEAITQVGVWLVRQVIRWADDAGWLVIYGDTDSVFVALPDGLGSDLHAEARSHVMCHLIGWESLSSAMAACSPEQVEGWGFRGHNDMAERFTGWADAVVAWQEFVTWVNAQWEAIFRDLGASGEVLIDLDFEKAFSRLLMVRKKRYAGLHMMYKGKRPVSGAPPEIKGLDIKRSDALPLARRMQSELVDMILGTGGGALPIVPGADAVCEWIDGWRDVLVARPVRLADVTMSQGLQKPVGSYFQEAAFCTKKCVGKTCDHEFGEGTKGAGPPACPLCGQARKRSRPGPHARVARQVVEAGGSVLPGDRIRWVAVLDEDSKGWTPVSADTPDVLSRVDLGYYWERTLTPSLAVVEVMFPSENWKQYAKEPRQIRLGLIRRKRALDNSDLPLFASVVVDQPEGDVVVRVPPGCSAADVDLLSACVQRSSGPCKLVVKLVVETSGGPVEVVMTAAEEWRVDPRLLAVSSPKIRRDDDGVFHLSDVVG